MLQHILDTVASLVRSFGKLTLHGHARSRFLDGSEKFLVLALAVVTHQVRKFEVDVVLVGLGLATLAALSRQILDLAETLVGARLCLTHAHAVLFALLSGLLLEQLLYHVLQLLDFVNVAPLLPEAATENASKKTMLWCFI